MNKTCLKCGATSEVEMTAFTACPKCGAVYSKVEQAEELRKAAELARAAKAEAAAAAPAPAPVPPSFFGPQTPIPEPVKRAPKPSSRGLAFHRFYSQELAVLLFWFGFAWIIVAATLAVLAAPTSAPLVIGGAFVSALFLRVVLETMAVLFQIHARLKELCALQRNPK